MSKTELMRYKLSTLPESTMLSPKFIFDWWEEVVASKGAKNALENKASDYKIARELWVAAVFAVCMRVSTGKEHWVSTIDATAPDAQVARFSLDNVGAFREIYLIEVTTYNDTSETLEEVLKKKLDKSYSPSTRIICYITKAKGITDIQFVELKTFIEANNPRGYEVWILGGFMAKNPRAKNPQKLHCLNSGEDYQIDVEVERTKPNEAEAVHVPDAKLISKDGKMRQLGEIFLDFPMDDVK